jgi:dolichol-phosphate mannosyltransferase
LHRPGKQGLGSATVAGIRWALSREYGVVVTMDADWSHDPQYLPALVEATERADIAIGSRYCAGGGIEGWPLYRRIMSRAMNWLSRRMLRLPVADSSGAFRAYRAAALEGKVLEQVRSAGYSYLEEILWQLRRAGATFEEVPISFRERRAGRSKISLGEAAAKVRVLWSLSKQRGARR